MLKIWLRLDYYFSRQIMPPSWFSRMPVGDSLFMMRVFIFLFWAICISLFMRFFRLSPVRYLSVSSRYSGLGFPGISRLYMAYSASSSEIITSLSVVLRRFSSSSRMFSVSSSVLSFMDCLKSFRFVMLLT